ncbi:RNA repair transcriptional activator RtcR family protein [Oceanicella sp. SM1341]|uniref:RNA repair transcriptional activator RtcR family protein n=1 Tax=Oceanicella sp. SM1341 TaxID=1548889 RepID=UPI000E4DD4BF|nr:RNA repair transcriptional activator RtcR family protein [Oceanicella sp. SM1341]
MRNVVIGFLGTKLDAGKRREWRPSVQLCTHPGFPVDRLELLHDRRHSRIAERVAADIATLSPETEVLPRRMELADPWDFQEVYGALFDFARDYGFDEDRERYHLHLTTGTHVAQICWFLLAESRHIPARLLQTAPPAAAGPAEGRLHVIDLDLSRYDALQSRFDLATRAHAALLRGGIDTANPGFDALIGRLEQVATTTDAPLLLTGPAGSGKTVLAGRIHELKLQRRRLKGRLVHVPCASLRGDRAMEALSGRRRAGPGSTERRGLLREADGGALFLDGIDALGPDEQAMILHAVESGTFLPVGSDQEHSARFQLIAAASADLPALVAQGRFRADLYARLSLWSFRLPPLAERREDIAANIAHELARAERRLGQRIGFNADAAERYQRFARAPSTPWHGNFRDLGASVERLCTLAPRGRVTLAMVEQEIAVLEAQWRGLAPDPEEELLAGLPGAEAGRIDPFDRAQLAATVAACRRAASLSEAGRALFAVSRLERSSRNDADRLRKYLARFGLSWEAVTAGR